MNELTALRFVQDLVKQASLSGAEQAVIARIQAEMVALSYDQIITDINGSVTGIIVGQADGPTLLLDAHCDTVGVVQPETWTHDPYAAAIDGDRLYGRGSADMKGALGAMIHAAASFDRAALKGRVAVSATVMEEVMEGIALGTVLDIIQPDWVVIGEATNLMIAHGGRGRAEIQLEAVGKPAHSSNPDVGINAVHKLLPAITAIERLHLPSDDLLGPAIMALTDIISDPYPGMSVIPARCCATYDRRLLVGETVESVIAALHTLPEMREVTVRIVEGQYTTYTGAALNGLKFFPAWKLAADHPLTTAGLNGAQAAGLTPALSAYRFCTNGATSAGVRGIPTIGFGPSREEMAHIIDEYVTLNEFSSALRGYRAIIEALLG